jgi:hypothetical protein
VSLGGGAQKLRGKGGGVVLGRAMAPTGNFKLGPFSRIFYSSSLVLKEQNFLQNFISTGQQGDHVF